MNNENNEIYSDFFSKRNSDFPMFPMKFPIFPIFPDKNSKFLDFPHKNSDFSRFFITKFCIFPISFEMREMREKIFEMLERRENFRKCEMYWKSGSPPLNAGELAYIDRKTLYISWGYLDLSCMDLIIFMKTLRIL